jgi:iron complex outermembrane receptor protein
MSGPQSSGAGARQALRVGLLATAAALVIVPAAQAQNAARGANVSEVIVTARKRQESALKVPVIETVLSSRTIDRAAISNIDDIQKFAPGLKVGGAVISIGTQVAIRGIGTNAYDPGTDQTVSLNIDGLSLTQGLAYQSGTFDLQQIEVLKGPQALFFGKSSPAGVVSMRTADPGSKFEVIARTSYEIEAREKRGEFIVSGPLSEALGVRLAGQVWNGDGYFKNKAVGLPSSGSAAPSKRMYGTDGYHIRGTVLFHPSSAFDGRLKINYVDERTDYNSALHFASCPEGVGVSPGNPLPPPLDPREECKLNRTTYLVDLAPNGFPLIGNGGKPVNDKQQLYGTLEMNYRPSQGLTLTSVTGYYKLKSYSVFNTYNTSLGGPGLGIESWYDRKEFSQEVRLTSDFTSPFNFMAGAFYQDGDVTLLQPAYINHTISPAITASRNLSQLDIKSWSLFGQARYKVTETVELAAGGRYTHEKRAFLYTNLLTNAVVPTLVPKISSGTFSPELTINYTPTNDLTLFASYKKGYKSGSFAITSLPTVPAGTLPDASFHDENIKGFEGGVKSRLADRQVQLNLAAYYYKVDGLQVGSSVRTEAGNLPVTRVVNAGAGRVYGLDFEVTYNPQEVEGLSLHGAVAWNNAKFTDLKNIPCWGGQTVADGCNQQLNPATGLYTAQNLDGLPFLRAPHWQGTVGAVYDMALDNGMGLTFSGESAFSSRYLTVVGRRPDFWRPGYVKFDASVALKGRDNRWELALIGKNLGGKITSGNCFLNNAQTNFLVRRIITGGTTRGPDGIEELSCAVDNGRAIMARLTYRPLN